MTLNVKPDNFPELKVSSFCFLGKKKKNPYPLSLRSCFGTGRIGEVVIPSNPMEINFTW